LSQLRLQAVDEGVSSQLEVSNRHGGIPSFRKRSTVLT
jgi:hypothetical protein